MGRVIAPPDPPGDPEIHRLKELVGDMTAALDLCLACNGLTWEAEQEALVVTRRARELVPTSAG